MAKNAPVEM